MVNTPVGRLGLDDGLDGIPICQRVREHSDKRYVYILLRTAGYQKKIFLPIGRRRLPDEAF